MPPAFQSASDCTLHAGFANASALATAAARAARDCSRAASAALDFGDIATAVRPDLSLDPLFGGSGSKISCRLPRSGRRLHQLSTDTAK